MTALDAASFDEFFGAVNRGRTPFPWQRQLVASVLDEGRWPQLIDVPTGLGKTSVLDIAVYVLAATAGSQSSAGRRRMLFVVDRRLVVDEAYEHAQVVAHALADSEAGIVAMVAERLRGLRGPDGEASRPLEVARMRGGITWDAAWVDRPDQPIIAVGTVDQIGSRLLFRGYGTTDSRKPMDAALIGTDSLFIVDEAHLAGALLATTGRARRLDVHGLTSIAPVDVMQLTATATGDRPEVALAFDRYAHLADPVAGQRLLAGKHLRLALTDPKKITDTLAELALEQLATRPGARALIVCNTVARARHVHSALAAHGAKRHPQADTPELREPELLIGRARPYERDRRIDGVLSRFGIDRARDHSDNDVLVATQTVEVGANLDVDVLITESAPLSAIVQRLGRLNRLGRSTITQPCAIVVHDGVDDDPIYGEPRRLAWDFLVTEVGGVRAAGGSPEHWPSLDAGPLALRELSEHAPATAFASVAPHVPYLAPATLRAWARTSPRPDPDLDPYLPAFLHGVDTDIKNVQLFWRDDLDGADAALRLEARPYRSGELVEVPLRAAVRWLTGAKADDVADVDAPAPDDDLPAGSDEPLPVWLRRDGTWVTRRPDQIRPGDVVAVQSERGGLDEFGWDPSSATAVTDISDLVSAATRRPTLRIDTRTPSRILRASGNEPASALIEAIGDLRDVFWPPQDKDPLSLVAATRNLVAALDGLAEGDLQPGYAPLIEVVRTGKVEAITRDGLMALKARRPADGDLEDAQDANDDGEIDSSTGLAHVTLSHHHESVGRRTAIISAALGLSADLTELLTFAAAHHDLGKLDVRFQAALRDGNTFMADLFEDPLAKSGIDPRSLEARIARRRSGLPAGYRHEIWSAQLAAAIFDSSNRPAWHLDLVTHLIAAHHGNSRPMFIPVLDAAPTLIEFGGTSVKTVSEASFDLESSARFDRLNDRFGIWGLALLETIVRSADQTCSREGS